MGLLLGSPNLVRVKYRLRMRPLVQNWQTRAALPTGGGRVEETAGIIQNIGERDDCEINEGQDAIGPGDCGEA